MADTSNVWTIAGISVGSLWTGTGIWAGLIGMGTYWIKGRPAMRKMRIEADEQLRNDLMAQLELVRKNADERVTKLEDKLERQRLEYEAKIAEKDAKFDKEMAILRHRANNMAQCLDAIVMLVEASPENASSHILKVKEMRDKQELREAAEKGLYAEDKIARASKPIKI